MRLGLDLQGGTRLVLEADLSKNPDVNLNDALNSAVDVVERRVNAFGVAESITERVGSQPHLGAAAGHQRRRGDREDRPHGAASVHGDGSATPTATS